LQGIGVKRVFSPGTPLTEIVEWVSGNVAVQD
jgi:methylmalonyl-CoA mutase cobalamin-binding subunit